MRVEQIMTWNPECCYPTDSLNDAARLMWEGDFGSLPVKDGDGRLVGMITDRDVCMAAYTQGGSLRDHTVATAMAETVVSCTPEHSVADAEKLMQDNQVRRIPVQTDGRLVGILSLNDIAIGATRTSDAREVNFDVVGRTLSRICEHRATAAAE